MAVDARPAGAMPRWRIVGALGIVEIFAYGGSFYLPTVLAKPIAVDTGWPLGLVAAGASLSLLVSGVAAPRAGALIARVGGRAIMASGVALLAIGLAALAAARHPLAYLGAWALIGGGMSASLYDAAFSTLAGLFGTDARRPISAVTLLGGFASTVCWPLSAWLVDVLGWRGTCLVYAAIHLLVALPLLLLLVPAGGTVGQPNETPGIPVAAEASSPGRGRPLYLLIATALVIAGFQATLIAMHLVTLLQARGIAPADAVALGMLIGPAQVGGRLLELAFGARLHPAWTLVAAGGLVAIGIGLLSAGAPLPGLALALYGAGNGIWTIARGALPLAVFGARDYPLVMGRLSRPIMVALAAAPAAGGVLIDVLGAPRAFALVAATAVVNVLVAALVLRASLAIVPAAET